VLADAEVDRALVVGAHPDDVDFGAGGTIASWTASGIDVAYCIATYGDAGGFDETPREQMPALRDAEQRAAARILGVDDVTFLGYPDGAVTATLDLRRDIARQIRRVRPQRVLLPSPERNWLRVPASHPDHLAVGEAAMCAVYPDARNPFAFPELLADEELGPWTVPEVWVMGAPHPDHYVDVTATFDLKLAALRAHVTQVSHRDDLDERVRGLLGAAARAAGLPAGRLAEAFRVVSIPS
jgi:LmbE family N-acetylglucosaminyl deacetylase